MAEKSIMQHLYDSTMAMAEHEARVINAIGDSYLEQRPGVTVADLELQFRHFYDGGCEVWVKDSSTTPARETLAGTKRPMVFTDTEDGAVEVRVGWHLAPWVAL